MFIKRGAVFAKTGATGAITGPHLHFEARDAQDRALNPELFFGVMPHCNGDVGGPDMVYHIDESHDEGRYHAARAMESAAEAGRD